MQVPIQTLYNQLTSTYESNRQGVSNTLLLVRLQYLVNWLEYCDTPVAFRAYVATSDEECSPGFRKRTVPRRLPPTFRRKEANLGRSAIGHCQSEFSPPGVDTLVTSLRVVEIDTFSSTDKGT
jgi:hypothetical protein